MLDINIYKSHILNFFPRVCAQMQLQPATRGANTR